MNEGYKTKRQWALEGYTPKEDCTGATMWANKLHQKAYIYFSEAEVRPMTEAEKAAYAEEKRAKRRAAREARQAALAREKAREAAFFEACRKRQEHYNRVCAVKAGIVEAVGNASLCPVPADLIVVDAETTGLDPVLDELLQVSILSGDGTVLYNSYLRPACTETWPDAQAVNGITPEKVADAPLPMDEMLKIAAILSGAKCVVGYNSEFVLEFLAGYGCEPSQDALVMDVMSDFAPVYDDWDESIGDFRWQKLSTCAAYYGYDWGDTCRHDSLADCRATLFCYRKLNEEGN